jgi:YfiH family protein
VDLTLPAGDGLVARVVSTTAAAGDFTPGADGLALRRACLVDAPWTWLEQVHGAEVAVITAPGAAAGEAADAAVTTVPGAPLSIRTADCVPVVLVGEGGLGVVHAGWRGLVSGVVRASVDAMSTLGVVVTRAVVGPHICPGCYEFGAADLSLMADVFGAAVVAATRAGRAALDLDATVRSALADCGVTAVEGVGDCTACEPGYWSHRARGDSGRQVTVAWLEEIR